ncbi:YjeJ family protein [Shigella flexneri]
MAKNNLAAQWWKTREATPGKEIEAITRQMLDFSPRLKKLAGVPCQVYVRIAANDANR